MEVCNDDTEDDDDDEEEENSGDTDGGDGDDGDDGDEQSGESIGGTFCILKVIANMKLNKLFQLSPA